MPQLEPLNLKLTGSADGLSVAIGKAEASLGGFGKFVGGLSSLATPFTATLAAGLAGVAAAGLSAHAAISKIREAMVDVDALNDSANRLGVTFSELQGIRLAIGEATGADSSTIDAAISKMQINLVEAAQEGSGKAYDALQRLGLDAGQLLAAGPQRSIEMIATAMQGITIEAERNKLAFDLLGKSGAAIAAALRTSPESLREAADWANRNLSLTGQQVEQIGMANDAWGRVSMQIDGIFQSISAELSPLLQLMAEDVLGVGENFSGIDEYIKSAVDVAGELYGIFKDIVELVIAAPRMLYELVTGDLAGVGDAFTDAFSFDSADKAAKRIAEIRNKAAQAAGSLKPPSEADIAQLESQSASEEAVKKAKEAARASEEWVRKAERLRQQLRSPEQKLQDDLSELRGAVEQGGLDWQTYAKGISSVTDEFVRAQKAVNSPLPVLSAITGRAQQIKAVAEMQNARREKQFEDKLIAEVKEMVKKQNELINVTKAGISAEPPILNLDS